MNRLSIAAGLFAVGAVALSGQARAACLGDKTLVDNADQVLSGKTVCMKKEEQWTDSRGITTLVTAGYQEEHLSDHQLWDYKQGPTPPSTPFPNPPSADPRKQVGTWATNGNQVTYTYGGSLSYTYTLYLLPSGHYCLVGNDKELEVIVQAGTGGPCTAYPTTN